MRINRYLITNRDVSEIRSFHNKPKYENADFYQIKSQHSYSEVQRRNSFFNKKKVES